jgi:cold shock CspA family protein
MARPIYIIVEDNQEGRVKWFDPNKGFGFIDGGKDQADVFLHSNHILGDFLPIKGDRISYKLATDQKRKRNYAVEASIL